MVLLVVFVGTVDIVDGGRPRTSAGVSPSPAVVDIRWTADRRGAPSAGRVTRRSRPPTPDPQDRARRPLVVPRLSPDAGERPPLDFTASSTDPQRYPQSVYAP